MRTKISAITLGLLLLPLTSFASVDSSLSAAGSYTTGTDSQFEARMSNYQATTDTVSVLNISDSNASDIKSASFLDKSGWVQLTPYQSGSDVLARFISDTGFEVGGQRVITLRINFKTPKTYIVGFALQNNMGQTLSSAAAPVVVGGKVLGESTTAPASGTFTRQLKYGSIGADVTALQNRLTAEGVYTGPITGNFYSLTQAGVKRYQAKVGIKPANGVVGPATLAALNQ